VIVFNCVVDGTLSVTATENANVSAAVLTAVDVFGVVVKVIKMLAPAGSITFPMLPVFVSVYCKEYGPEPKTDAAHAGLQSGTPPVVGIEPVGAVVGLAASGMEIVIVVIPGLPIGFDTVIVLVTVPVVAMLA
jgi:hypothetical protein